MIKAPEVDISEVYAKLNALGATRLWSQNDNNEFYTIVPNEGLGSLKLFADEHPDLIEVTPYPKDHKIKLLLLSEDPSHAIYNQALKANRYQRITLKAPFQDFKPNEKNIAKREDGVRPRHIAFCNAEIYVDDNQRKTVQTIKAGEEITVVPHEKIFFLQVISPLLTAREIYRCFPKEEVRKRDKKGNVAFWKLPELTVLTSDQACNIKNKNELLPLREKNAADDKDMNIYFPVELLPAFLPNPAIRFLKERYNLNVSTEPQQLGLDGIVPNQRNSWFERAQAREAQRPRHPNGR